MSKVQLTRISGVFTAYVTKFRITCCRFKYWHLRFFWLEPISILVHSMKYLLPHNLKFYQTGEGLSFLGNTSMQIGSLLPEFDTNPWGLYTWIKPSAMQTCEAILFQRISVFQYMLYILLTFNNQTAQQLSVKITLSPNTTQVLISTKSGQKNLALSLFCKTTILLAS